MSHLNLLGVSGYYSRSEKELVAENDNAATFCQEKTTTDGNRLKIFSQQKADMHELLPRVLSNIFGSFKGVGFALNLFYFILFFALPWQHQGRW